MLSRRRFMQSAGGLVLAPGALSAGDVSFGPKQLPDESKIILKSGTGLDKVTAHCSACHSLD